MTTIIKNVKRASQASNRRSIAIARLRAGLSMAAAERLPGDDAITAFVALARGYRQPAVEVTQDLSALKAQYSK